MWRMLLSLCVASGCWAQAAGMPVPRLQAIPLPDQQVSFQRDGDEIARYHFGPALRRPFVYPVVGPSGRSLTRMGHPRDPESHSHHNSVWISHESVNGISFWGDRQKGRIAHQRIDEFEDVGEHSWIISVNHWIDEQDNKVLLVERRRTAVQLLDADQWMLVIDLRFDAKEPVTFGKTPFGLIGVRMAKTIGVNDGGGTIRNSAGQVNEGEIFWKPARWCDYSGPIARGKVDGITLMDHPSNFNHPTKFHVRGDGWMGASLTIDEPKVIEAGKPLTLRYGLFVHVGQPSPEELEKRWAEFAKAAPADLTPKRK